MDYIEMSSLMDVLYNNITSNQAPGLSEYEKSLFLTKAQDEKVKNYFNPKSNQLGEGFDGNQKRQIDFSAITSVFTQNTAGNFTDALFDTRPNSKSTSLPEDVWMIVNERIKVKRTSEGPDKTEILTVKPISYEEYDRLMSKPFKRPLKYQAWRLINNSEGNKSDLIVGPNDNITEYKLRYIRKPKPIIIGDTDGITIDGYLWGGPTTPAEPEANKIYGNKVCELDPIVHEEIVQRAVELAKIAWTVTGQDNTQLELAAGQRSE